MTAVIVTLALTAVVLVALHEWKYTDAVRVQIVNAEYSRDQSERMEKALSWLRVVRPEIAKAAYEKFGFNSSCMMHRDPEWDREKEKQQAFHAQEIERLRAALLWLAERVPYDVNLARDKFGLHV